MVRPRGPGVNSLVVEARLVLRRAVRSRAALARVGSARPAAEGGRGAVGRTLETFADARLEGRVDVRRRWRAEVFGLRRQVLLEDLRAGDARGAAFAALAAASARAACA